MTREEVLEKLKDVITENNRNKEIDLNLIREDSELFKDLGFDSMQMVYTTVLIEKSFNCKINNEEYRNLKTVGDIIDIILAKNIS